ncbi:MAG: hypothetical protein MUW56_16935 [Chryseobacterium sp.]|uniref:hypothetical protein n=1 Tax=Chryseobacterium sp. TaxID=1871047 RepID=UPI0025BE16B7|nr:hypothetical protein [Chryseobacterium sp.]MCJ7935256.1 hypothetical protein [Chryseobacterium sp.]
MLIHSENGVIELKAFGTRLYKGMSYDQLKQTDFYQEKYHTMRDIKTGYLWYSFDPIEIQGYQLYFNLCFLGDQLHSIHMNTWEKSDAQDWNEWTEEKEVKVFYRNNKFLSSVLPTPPPQKKKTPYPRVSYLFPWGSIWSVYDPRSASSLMGIHYNEEEKVYK